MRPAFLFWCLFLLIVTVESAKDKKRPTSESEGEAKRTDKQTKKDSGLVVTPSTDGTGPSTSREIAMFACSDPPRPQRVVVSRQSPFIPRPSAATSVTTEAGSNSIPGPSTSIGVSSSASKNLAETNVQFPFADWMAFGWWPEVRPPEVEKNLCSGDQEIGEGVAVEVVVEAGTFLQAIHRINSKKNDVMMMMTHRQVTCRQRKRFP